jgi:membrane-associated PAP2 superfamily phosphatase
MNSRRFYFTHLWIPLAVFIALAATLELSHLDLTLGQIFYHAEGDSWALKNHWLLEQVLHRGGRNLMVLMLVILLGTWSLSFTVAKLKPYQQAMGYLFLSAGVAATLVSVGKHTTGVNCPWDLALFGGSLDYTPIFSRRPDTIPAGQCFPAGHASAGYAWMGLYFIALRYAPSKRGWALGLVLLLGLLFGVTQQLRGAHFVSHDLWTLAICWFSALACYCVIYPRPLPRATPLT